MRQHFLLACIDARRRRNIGSLQSNRLIWSVGHAGRARVPYGREWEQGKKRLFE